MSVNLIKERRKRRKLIQRYSLPPVTDDEEMRFSEKAVFWMAVLAVTPLILFHIIYIFYPNFLWIPITPY
jgi:hypothetical protein